MNSLTHLCLSFPLEIVVLYYDPYESNQGMIDGFSKYLKESYMTSSVDHFSFNWFGQRFIIKVV